MIITIIIHMIIIAILDVTVITAALNSLIRCSLWGIYGWHDVSIQNSRHVAFSPTEILFFSRRSTSVPSSVTWWTGRGVWTGKDHLHTRKYVTKTVSVHPLRSISFSSSWEFWCSGSGLPGESGAYKGNTGNEAGIHIRYGQFSVAKTLGVFGSGRVRVRDRTGGPVAVRG